MMAVKCDQQKHAGTMISVEGDFKEIGEMFERIDKEEDGEVYTREVLDFLRVMSHDMDQTEEVEKLLHQYGKRGDKILYLPEFKEMMSDVRAAGWTRFEPVDGQPIAEKDMKKVFKMVDLNKGGTISQVELKMGLKFIGRRYGLSDMKPWQDAMKMADNDGDGDLSFLEFQDAIKLAEIKLKRKDISRK